MEISEKCMNMSKKTRKPGVKTHETVLVSGIPRFYANKTQIYPNLVSLYSSADTCLEVDNPDSS